jgi:hypothetical protein
MAIVYTIKRPKLSAVFTMNFKDFETARNFSLKSESLNASKPYKRMRYIDGKIVPVWSVSLPSGKDQKATWIRQEMDVSLPIETVLSKVQRKKIKSNAKPYLRLVKEFANAA